MLDRPEASSDYPAGHLQFAPGQQVLCLAPHPDDEIIGCGGLLALAASQGAKVQTIIVSAGEQGLTAAAEHGNPRLAESIAAAKILDISPPQCWYWPDREVRYGPPLIDRVVQAIVSVQPTWLLLPAVTEPHPDHQALALAGMAALMQCEIPCTVLFYEVGAPIVPNTLLDISRVAQAKWEALGAFVSQEERHPYTRHAQAMATLRALGMGPGVAAAEAYWQVSAKTLRQSGSLDGMGFWPLQRQAMRLASTPEQLPLVSVLVRSMDRLCLAQALASVVAQTYPNIEVVVVNATGRVHSPIAYPPQRLSLKVVGTEQQESTSNSHPLSRSAAANTALASARGVLALFLDDDDLLLANHVEKLVEALQENAGAVAAYTGARVEGVDGQAIREYNTEWSRQRLLGINFLPIHSVLFRIEELRHGGFPQFDEALPVLEDWDFWCQLAERGDFVHVPGISAIYRQGQGTSHLSDPAHVNHWAAWHQKILSRHIARLGPERHIASLAWHAVTLDQLELRYGASQKILLEMQAELKQEQTAHAVTAHEIRTTQIESANLKHERDIARSSVTQLEQERDLLQTSIDMLQRSRPVRWARRLRRLLSLGEHKGGA